MSEDQVDNNLVDMRKVSQLPNGDMVQQRPRGYMRPDTVSTDDLQRELGQRVGDDRALDHAAQQRGRRAESAQDVVEKAAAAAAQQEEVLR